jgi:hypothetical protein
MSLKMKFIGAVLTLGLSSVVVADSNVTPVVKPASPQAIGVRMANCFAYIHYAQSYTPGKLDTAKADAASKFYLVEGERRLGDKFFDANSPVLEKYVVSLEATKRSSPEQHLEIKMSLLKEATVCVLAHDALKR